MDFVEKYVQKINDEIERKMNIIKKIEENDINTLLDIRYLIVYEYFSKVRRRMGRLKERDIIFNQQLKNDYNDKLLIFDIQNNINSEHFPLNQHMGLPYKQIHRIL